MAGATQNRRCELSIRLDIVNDQDFQWPRFFFIVRDRLLLGLRFARSDFQWDFKPKRRALPHFTFDIDLPAVRFDYTSAYREPQSGAAVTPLVTGIELAKSPE
jgi:hypothetical protein